MFLELCQLEECKEKRKWYKPILGTLPFFMRPRWRTASLMRSTSCWYLFRSFIAPSLASLSATSSDFTRSMVAFKRFSSFGSSHRRSALSRTSYILQFNIINHLKNGPLIFFDYMICTNSLKKDWENPLVKPEKAKINILSDIKYKTYKYRKINSILWIDTYCVNTFKSLIYINHVLDNIAWFFNFNYEFSQYIFYSIYINSLILMVSV